jgi:precorrin-6A/cobalt-precorrin-6A reductase
VLAEELARLRDTEVVSSLAGRVREPTLPAGEVRIGGFGGVEGLRNWLSSNGIDAVVDATHPFAAQITGNAVAAAVVAGVPILVLRRPPWLPAPGDRWTTVATLDAAAERTATLGTRVFLTIGRQGVDAFANLADMWFLIRAIDPPTVPVPVRHELLLERGPFTVDHELALLRAHRIDVLVTKNSGGSLTEAKLGAARELALPVVMVERPPLPNGINVVHSTAAALDWLRNLNR